MGSYYVSGSRDPIPQEVLSVYIAINPRSQIMAAKNLAKDLINKITEDHTNYNVSSMSLNAVHKAKSRTNFIDFDFDNNTSHNVYTQIKDNNYVNFDAVSILETRGGCHVLIEVNKVEEKYKKSFYNDLQKIDGCDVRGDNLIPIPGCYQGGFIPKFYKGD